MKLKKTSLLLAAVVLLTFTACEGPIKEQENVQESRPSERQTTKGGQEVSLRLVPTFNCISVYLAASKGQLDTPCKVEYRSIDEEDWKQGMSMEYDPKRGEYRGSIVNLAPGKTWQVKVRTETMKKPLVAETSTWEEEFPVAKIITLPEITKETYKVRESGTPEGYVVYQPEEGKEAVIDVGKSREFGLTIRAQYVIIRGITIKNANKHGIIFDNGCHHVIIEECDISAWGSDAGDGWGRNLDSAIFGEGKDIHNLVIQRNRIHHPRTDSNSWQEPRPAYNGSLHPAGPQAVTLDNTVKGNNVIRYNSVYSDEDHYFNDAFSGSPNFSSNGFPGPDSDIYGNYIERCWDNPIEAEGGGMNVRIWGNYMDRSYSHIAIVPVALGPTYIWKNIIDRSRKGPLGNTDGDPRGRIKAGSVTDRGKYHGDGRIYFFHNTVYQRKAPEGMKYPLGCSKGIDGSAGILTSLVSRNNILEVYHDYAYSIYDNSKDIEGLKVNDLDYDLYNGKVLSPVHQEKHGIKASPLYDMDNGPLEFVLDAASPGIDAGLPINNFNDEFEGKGPDMGAQERGKPVLEFGAGAYTGNPAELDIFNASASEKVVADIPADTVKQTLEKYSFPLSIDFEDSNLKGWNIKDGTWTLDDNDNNKVLKQTDPEADAFAIWDEFSLTDYTVKARIMPLEFNGDKRPVLLLARVLDDENFYYACLRSNNKLQIRNKIAGTTNTVVEKDYIVETGRWYDIEFSLKGERLELYVDGNLELSGIDTVFTEGSFGISTYMCKAGFDDIEVVYVKR